MDVKIEAEQPLELEGKPIQEPIFIRRGRLKSFFNGHVQGSHGGGKSSGRRGCHGQELDELTGDVLLDSFMVLYDEFRTSNEKDEYHQFFVNKYAKSFAAIKNSLVNLNDFTIGSLIGAGRFGQVRRAREDRSGRVYAVKILEKSDILVQKHIPSLDNELTILSSAKSSWLASLKYSFHSPDSLYFVTEYVPGGDFNSIIRLSGGKLSEDSTRFYMAELILAIEALHCFGYAHRDIRPENILFDRMGHIKLIDFGSSAKIGKDNKVMGRLHLGNLSPSYVAPEILQSLEDDDEKRKLEDQECKYGPGCDYWSLGVLAFEWMFGDKPFTGATNIQTFKNIIAFKTYVKFPTYIEVSQDFICLLKDLLTDEQDRIGYTKLLRHSFFHSIIWDGIRDEISPYMRITCSSMVKSEDEVSHFPEVSVKSSMFLPASCSTKRAFSAKAFVGFTRTMLESCGGGGMYKNGSAHGLNTSMNTFNSTATWTSSSACLSFYDRDRDDLGEDTNCNYAKQLQIKAELEIKLELIEKKNAKINNLESKLDILNSSNSDKDCKIASLSSQVKRLQCEKDNALKGLEEERKARQTIESNIKDLVSGTKVSQQKKLSEMQKEVILFKNQIFDKDRQLQDYQKILSTLREENMKLKVEMEHSSTVKIDENSLRNFRQSVRQSMSMMESRMNSSSYEWETKIQDLQSKHSQELDHQKDLRLKQEVQFSVSINSFKCELNDLIGRLEESRRSREATLAELNQLYNKYDQLKKNSQNKINQLHSQLHTVQTDLQTKAEETFTALESQLEETKNERDHMSIRIDALVEETHQKEVQIQNLGEVTGRLEQSIASVDKYRVDFLEILKQSQENLAGGFQYAEKVLQEQLTKAQESLEKSVAQNFEEMQKSKELEQKQTEIEREFTVVRMELELLRKEKKELDAKLERLEVEKSMAQTSLKIMEVEKADLDMKMGSMAGEIQDLKSTVGSSERALKEATETVDNLKENQARINREYDEIAAELKESQNKLLEYDELRVNLDDRNKVMQEKDNALDEKDRKISMLTNNVQALDDITAVLEDQLKDLNKILAIKDDEAIKFKKTVSTLELEKAELEDELRFLKSKLEELQQWNSFKGRRLSDVSAALKSEESHREKVVAALTEKMEKLKEENYLLSFRIAEMEGDLEELRVSKANLMTNVDSSNAENRKLKEKVFRLISQIAKTKELNITLKAAIEDAGNKIERCENVISQKTETVSALEAEKADLESQFQATLSQHKKIIELLQKKSNIKRQLEEERKQSKIQKFKKIWVLKNNQSGELVRAERAHCTRIKAQLSTDPQQRGYFVQSRQPASSGRPSKLVARPRVKCPKCRKELSQGYLKTHLKCGRCVL